MKDLANMSKAELMDYAASLQKKSGGTKAATLGILENADGWVTIEYIADQIDISKNNVSSQLTAIRKQGHKLIEFCGPEGKQIRLVTPELAETLGLVDEFIEEEATE